MSSKIENAIGIVQRLREIAKNIEHAELRNDLADLSHELADAKLEASSLKERVASLEEDLRLARHVNRASDQEPVDIKWGCYQFEGDQTLYCTACWDNKRQKSTTHREDSRRRYCPVCRTYFGS